MMNVRMSFWLALAFTLGLAIGIVSMWPLVSAWQALAMDALDLSQRCFAPRTTL